MAVLDVSVDRERALAVLDVGDRQELAFELDELRQLRIKLDAAYWQLDRLEGGASRGRPRLGPAHEEEADG